MSYQPGGAGQAAITNSSMVVGAAQVSNLGHLQLLSTTVPSDAIGAIIETSSASSPQDTEIDTIFGSGTAYLDFATNTIKYTYSLWRQNSTTPEYGSGSSVLTATQTFGLLPSTTCHTIQIENYGGGRGQPLQVYSYDQSAPTGNAADRVSVEFILP